jgi:hypothetical protein
MMIEDSLQQSVYDYRVVVHITHIAIELALKAGLATTDDGYPATHSIEQLEMLFHSQFGKRILIRIPNYIRKHIYNSNPAQLNLFPNNLQEILKKQPNELEMFKYPVNRKGNIYTIAEIANLDQLHTDLCAHVNDIVQLQFIIWDIVELKTGRNYF